MHDRAYRRHQNERIIRKRRKILDRWHRDFKSLIASGHDNIHIVPYPDGKLRKYNLSCNCGLCDRNTIYGKRYPSVQEKKVEGVIQEELQDMYDFEKEIECTDPDDNLEFDDKGNWIK